MTEIFQTKTSRSESSINLRARNRGMSELQSDERTELEPASLGFESACVRQLSPRRPSKYFVSEMTFMDAISDPMIALMNKADRVDARMFAEILEAASPDAPDTVGSTGFAVLA